MVEGSNVLPIYYSLQEGDVGLKCHCFFFSMGEPNDHELATRCYRIIWNLCNNLTTGSSAREGEIVSVCLKVVVPRQRARRVDMERIPSKSLVVLRKD